MLDAEYLAAAEHRARRFSGAYTGTSGSLAADVIRLLAERRELMESLEAANRALREAVAARYAAADQKVTPPTVEESTDTIGIPGLKLVAFAGRIGSGKTAASGLVPGIQDCGRLQWADPLYAALAAMLGVPEDSLRDRTTKESSVIVHGVEPIEVEVRKALRTLGTEWGRELVNADLWVSIAVQRMRARHDVFGVNTFAICGTRFRNEVATVRRLGGEVWWIDRPGVEPPPPSAHTSDLSITPDDCDAVIVNDGTLDDLAERVRLAWADYTAVRC